MIKIILSLLSATLLFGEFEVNGHLDLDSQTYLSAPSAKHQNNYTLKQTLKFKYEDDDYSAFASLYAQEDYYDTKGTNSKNRRSFARLDELYLKMDFEDDSVEAGKVIKFWGALEFRNIVDVFNSKEFRDDLFSKINKLGVWNGAYSHYTDSGEISVIVKLYEQDQKMAAYPYVYYIFPTQVSYDNDLESSNGELRPSLYLKYSGSTDSEYPLDFAFIYENGYDSQRYFTPVVTQPSSYVQNAYLVNKFMTYNTLVLG